MADHELPGSHEEPETIVISNQELPEIAAWRNGQHYDIVKTITGAQQIRRTELIDGTVHVELALTRPPLFDGGVAK